MYVRTSSSRGLGDALTDCLAGAITTQEGVNPNFVGNNNPGNLVYAGQSGAVPGAGGFAKFPSVAAGQAALQWQIQNYINRGFNLTDFFNTYAPGNTTNAAGGVQTPAATQAYINNVSASCGLDTSTPLTQIQQSYTGPGSYVPSDSSQTSDSGTGFDISSWIPGFDPSQTYNIAGMVLSGSDLLLLGALVVGLLVISAIL
jgi:hypothetical protein